MISSRLPKFDQPTNRYNHRAKLSADVGTSLFTKISVPMFFSLDGCSGCELVEALIPTQCNFNYRELGKSYVRLVKIIYRIFVLDARVGQLNGFS